MLPLNLKIVAEPTTKQSWLRKLLLAVPLLFAMFCFWQALPDRVTSPQTAQAVSATSEPSRQLETVPIKEIRLGQRTIGRNPDREDTHSNQPEPVPETWREVHLELAKSDDSLVHVELLRPLAWLNYHQATTGGVIYLDLPEMGAQGFATVTNILPCPKIEPDTGKHRNVVTGRFIHNSSGNLIDLLVEGETEPTGVTDNHRYWSEDRQDFVEAAKLRIGEHLRLADGSTAKLSGMTRRPRDEPVYNLEIHGEHVYHVGSIGTLVHNNYKTEAVVIGQSMKRVKAAVRDLRARGVNAKWYQSWGKNWGSGFDLDRNLRNNKRWVGRVKKGNVDVYDIGIDPNADGSSVFYSGELKWFGDYPLFDLPGY